MGIAPLTSLDVHSHLSLLAVDMANRETVGWTRLVERLECWDALLHLSHVVSTQVSWQRRAFTHQGTSVVVASGRCIYAIF